MTPTSCPACGTEVTGARDPLDGLILCGEDGSPHTCGQVVAKPRTWVLELPAGLRLLSLNDRHHWAVKGRITRDLRKAAFVIARNARVPHLERARVVVEYQPPPLTRRRDLDNVGPASGKPCIDALVDARVLDGDEHPRYVAGIEYRVGEPYPRGRLVLHIEAVAAGAAGVQWTPPPGGAA